MIKYTQKHIKILKSWGMIKNPLIAIKDYSHLKSDLRWKNKEHLEAYDKYWIRREKWTKNVNFNKYYKKASKPIDKKTYNKTILFLEDILKLLHPFMPFLSEEIWHLIDDRESDIIISQWPEAKSIDKQLINEFNNTMEVVSGIRNIRKEKNIVKKEKLELFIIENEEAKNNHDSIIIKLVNLSKVEYTKKKIDQAFSFMVKANQYFVPLSDNFDKGAEIEKLNKDLDYTTGFLKIVETKLSNKKFIENAPKQLVDNEKNKLQDAKEKIRILTEKINSLS